MNMYLENCRYHLVDYSQMVGTELNPCDHGNLNNKSSHILDIPVRAFEVMKSNMSYVQYRP